MAVERDYKRLPVLYDLGGLHQDPWSGNIKDGDTSDERNIDHSTSGEWKSRTGMSYVGMVTSSTPNPTFHWHCDEAVTTSYAVWADDAGELATGESTMTASGVSVSTTKYAPSQGSQNAIYPSANATASWVLFDAATGTASNIVATSGAVQLYWRTVRGTDYAEKFSTYPPTSEVFLFDMGGNLKMCITTGGDIKAYLGTSAAMTLSDTTTDYLHNTWYKTHFSWDCVASSFAIYTDDVKVASTSADIVDIPTLTTAVFLNSNAYNQAPVTANWTGLSGEMFLVDEVSAWDAPYYPQKITGIFDNTSQGRLIITAGNQIFRTTSFTEIDGGAVSSGATIVANTRKSGCEWQGNFYLTTGDTTAGEGIVKIAANGTTWNDLANSPGGTKYIASYHNHLWAAGISGALQTVRCSEFDTDNVWTTVTGGSEFKCKDDVKGIAPYAGQLIVGTKSTIESIAGYRRADFTKTLLSNRASCASHWSMQEVTLPGEQQALVWAGYDGLYMCLGGAVTKISRRIQTYWDSLNAADLEDSCAIVYAPKGEYWLAVSTTGTDHDNIIVWNYEKDAFSVHTYDQKIDVLGTFENSGSYKVYGGNADGRLWEMRTGLYDDHKEIGGATPAYLCSKWFDVGFPETEKEFRALHVLYEGSGSGNIEVGWANNWVTTDFPYTTSISVSGSVGTAAVWDTAVWDTDVWGGTLTGYNRISEVHLHGDQSRGNAIRYRIRSTPGQTGSNFICRGFVKMWNYVEEYPA